MNQAQRAAVHEKLSSAPRANLVRALSRLIATEGRAQADHVDRPEDPSLGWFADGMDTAVNVVWSEISGGLELPGQE